MEAKSEPLMRVPAAVSNPKPEAKDPNKREMSTEEQRKLGIGLQSLPPEKIGHVVDILTERNQNLRDKDEFEVDVDALDTETLWELDRFVTNYKKIERQALMSHREVPAVEKIEVTMEEPLRVPAAVSDPNPPISAPLLPVSAPPMAKPKANDPNKRAMSMEEKHRLEIGLESLPQEKLEHVGHILTKRNGNLRQDDEIELDMDALDLETIWELDRFVTKYNRIS
ncbi:hypothetical protein Dsin_022870 [Dipteronia sinensis]|uniref:NET domain-containing protein n=1 Tax=Dipteronia sinensis TaxID=43782 RepID=A0AAE0A2C9_9ROSI|nr:hypothetical protein Dsin_022870 [Dipteronia sinensis]